MERLISAIDRLTAAVLRTTETPDDWLPVEEVCSRYFNGKSPQTARRFLNTRTVRTRTKGTRRIYYNRGDIEAAIDGHKRS